MPEVSSSAITRYDYDAGGRRLRIWFTSGRGYAYSGVPQSVVDGLAAAESKGAYFNEHIRDRYPYRRF